MKALLVSIVLLLTGFAQAQQADVQKTIEDFFVAFHAKDTVAMRAAFHPDMVLHSVSERAAGPKLEVETAKEMLKSIASIPTQVKFEERLLSFHVKIDGHLAHAWVPYDFYIDGKRSHGGVDSFTLINEGKGWKILYLVDTRRK